MTRDVVGVVIVSILVGVCVALGSIAVAISSDTPKPSFAPCPQFAPRCPMPEFVPAPHFKADPPIKAPTVTVPADAAGHWETQRQCGSSGCSLQRVWVPDVEQKKQESEKVKPADPPQCSGHWERRGLLGLRMVWVAD
jgi:hypothetical protein